MSVGRNLSVGVANSFWSALVGFLAVPLYLKFLGQEAYGLIGFFATTQALLQLLDFGLAPTTNREVSMVLAVNDRKAAANLVTTFEKIYWLMAIVIFVTLFAGAPLIAEHWLNANKLQPYTIITALRLMAVVIALKWSGAIYGGTLIGAQRLALASYINMFFVTLSTGGALIILAFYKPTIAAFFTWQTIIAFLMIITQRFTAWRTINEIPTTNFDRPLLKRIWRFSAGMNAVSIATLVFMQLDKVILSKMLTLVDYGHYMLSTQVVSALLILVTPVFNIIFPKFSEYVAVNNNEKILFFYRSGTHAMLSLLFPLTLALVFFSYDLILMWTHNIEIATQVAPVVRLLAIGTALNAAMIFPYGLQLAHGNSSIPLKICIILIIVMAPLTTALTLQLGIIGGGLAWLILNFLYLFLGTYLTHKLYLIGQAWTWLIKDVLAPLTITSLVFSAGWKAVQYVDLGSFLKLVSMGTLTLLAIAANIAFSKNTQLALRPYFNQIIKPLINRPS